MHSYSQDLLLPYQHHGWFKHQAGQAQAWEPSDTPDLYEENLKRQGSDWLYRHKPVTYTWNTNGYRAPEWASVDWANCWIIMGCSHVVGIGVAYEDTVGQQLSRLIDRPVINLGMGGSGVDIIAYNTIRLIDKGIRPLGVVVIAPQLVRLTYWAQSTYTMLNPHFQTYDPVIKSSYAQWLAMEPNAELHGYTQLRGALGMWEGVGVPVVSAHYYSEKPASHNIGLHLSGRKDYARDQAGQHGHFGVKTLAAWATSLAQSIQSL